MTIQRSITWCKMFSQRVRLIESITILRKEQGNPIRVSMFCNPRQGLPSPGCCKSWTPGWDSLVPSTMSWLIIFLPLLLFIIKSQILRRLSCTKDNAKTSQPMATSSSWQHHDVIIYMARNDGAKMLSQPRGWDTLGWDNISPDVQISGTDLSPVGE